MFAVSVRGGIDPLWCNDAREVLYLAPDRTIIDGRRIELHTGDGSTRASDVSGDLVMKTGDGSIVVERADGRLDAHTGDGGVALYLPAGFSANIDAHTGDGAIRSDLDLAVSANGKNRRTLRGRLGEGGPELRIRTGDGTISLRAS